MANPYDIYQVGLGIVGYRQVTREVEAAFKKCTTVFYLHTEPSVKEYLETLSKKAISLHYLYNEATPRIETYEKMIDIVLQEAQTDPPVSFALYGHPYIYVHPTHEITRRAPQLGLKVKVMPGISSFDCLMIDLEIDPAQSGFQMYEANDLLLYNRVLHPDVHCIIWQIGTVETQLYSTKANRPERFLRIKDYMLKFYPPDHVVTIAVSSTIPIARSKLTKIEIGRFEQAYEHIDALSSLYIPPIRSLSVIDDTYADILESPDHLNQFVEGEERIPDI